MPCLIKDAWDEHNFIKTQYSFHKKNHDDIKKKIYSNVIVPDNAYDYQDLYNNVQYPYVDHSNELLSVYPVRERCEDDDVSIECKENQIKQPHQIDQSNLIKESKYDLNLQKYIQELQYENSNLRQLIQQQMHSKKDTNEHSDLFDLIIYICSGIFIILLLESLLKLIKKK